ncbi:MAG: N-acetylmuramoyl-L-alanine amidase [Clostridia bacterium]|nr:N-acetylmuramoyl-L-alanine amidase [Clostridia bacterium]
MKKYRNICFAVLAVLVLALCIGLGAHFFGGNGDDLTEDAIASGQGIIRSVGSSDTLRVSPGEEVTLLVVAKNGADVYVKWGASRYNAKKPSTDEGYSAYFFKIKMPSSAGEIASMGKITAVASLDGQTEQMNGPEIAVVVPEIRPSTTQGSSVYDIHNYNPSYIDTEQQVLPTLNEVISKATTNPFTTPYTGNQMAVVTAENADTKSAEGEYVPYLPALAKGTMDFVVGESSYVDEDEGETYYYYDLASGMKVQRDSVVLQTATSMPENHLKVNSVYCNGSQLTVRLQTDWKVPYVADFKNQYYYSAHGFLFNVTDFSSTGLSITFNYTTMATGDIDCRASDIVSAAEFSVSPQNKTATLNFSFRQQGVYYGYEFYYEGSEAVITIKSKPKALNGSVVVLDPGHGKKSCGTTGLSEAVKESDINILVAYQVKTALEQQGVTVYMTRYGDEDITLEGRKLFARTVKPDLFVSLHCDGSENKESIGPSTFYYKPFSMALASNIYYELLSVYRNNLYPGRTELYDKLSRGVKFYPFSVTRLDECPSTLVEMGFLTNDNECYMLTRTENQQLIGQAIARGIVATLTQ